MNDSRASVTSSCLLSLQQFFFLRYSSRVESCRASASVSAIQLAYPRSPEFPPTVQVFFVLKCHYADMSLQTSFLICDLEISRLRIISCCTIAIYISHILRFMKSILKSLVIFAMWLALSGAIYSRIALSFVLNRTFFSANEDRTVKQNNQSDFKAIFLN